MSNETIMTGFSGLDKVLGGLRPRTLNVISGRPNIGKTSLALNIAMNVAKTSGKAVVYYSIESARSEIVHRLLMPKLVYKGESGTAEPVKTILNGVADLPIYVDDCSNLTSELLMERFDALLADMINVGLVIIDYFDLISFDGESYCSRHLESMEISKALKLFACKYEVPVVVLKQCSKKAEYRKDHIPALEDIRCWGSLDQVADSVIFIADPVYYFYHLTEECDRVKKLIVAKNRYGEKNISIPVGWHVLTASFSDVNLDIQQIIQE